MLVFFFFFFFCVVVEWWGSFSNSLKPFVVFVSLVQGNGGGGDGEYSSIT
jgi:hypothetical protein